MCCPVLLFRLLQLLPQAAAVRHPVLLLRLRRLLPETVCLRSAGGHVRAQLHLRLRARLQPTELRLFAECAELRLLARKEMSVM
jgi:hypothetical protein